MASENPTSDPKTTELDRLVKEFDQYEWQYLKTREDLRALWSLDVMTYTIYWPGAQGSPGFAYLFTNRGLAFAINYVSGDLTYDDLRSVLPDLPESFEALKPWDLDRITVYLPKDMAEFGKMKLWDFDGYQNINGWYWYGLHSGCWARIHESIWPSFYELAEHHKDLWIARYWGIFARKAIADREEQIEDYLQKMNELEVTFECAEVDAREVAKWGIVAWRESDQGWGGLLCKNGKAYHKLNLDFETLGIPITHRMEIRNDTLPGWRCIYCGLGHRLMVREEYYPRFRELTYGMGKNANLYMHGFALLKSIFEMAD